MTIVAERALEYYGDNGVEPGCARVFLPFDEGQNWRCNYQLSWPGYDRMRHACGEDSWQALQLAMQILPVEISVTDAFKSGKLGWLGETIESKADLVKWLAPQSMDVLKE